MLQRILRRLTAGDLLRIGLQVGDELVGLALPRRRHFAVHAALVLLSQLRMRLLIGRQLVVPGALALGARLFGVPLLIDLLRDFKGCRGPAQLFTRQRHFRVAQRRAVRLLFTGFVRRTETDNGAADNQRRLVGDALRLFNRAAHRLGVVAVDLADDVPVIGFETLMGVVGKPAFGFAIDRDAVMVIEADQLAEAERARQRADFVGDPLHQAAVAHKHVGKVVDDVVTRTVELRRQRAFSDRQTHGVGQPLAQRPGGGFDARRVADFRVARRFRVQLTEVLQLFHRQIVAGEVQQAIEQHRAVAVGKNKTVAVGPCGVSRVVFQVVAPQHFGDVRHAHRHARVT